MNSHSLQQIADQLHQIFPELSKLEIAQLALDEARKNSAPQHQASPPQKERPKKSWSIMKFDVSGKLSPRQAG